MTKTLKIVYIMLVLDTILMLMLKKYDCAYQMCLFFNTFSYISKQDFELMFITRNEFLSSVPFLSHSEEILILSKTEFRGQSFY